MFTIIGELINSTREEVKKALVDRDEDKIRELTRNQWEAGAKILDVNAGEMLKEEVEVTEWIIDVIQDEEEQIRISIDTAKPEAMEAGLRKCKNKPIINSITNEDNNKEIRILASEYDAEVIGLAMGEKGMPEGVEDRMLEVEALLEKCDLLGIERENLYVDSIAMSVGSSPDQGRHVLETVRRLKKEYDLKTSLGVSNISFGLPDRTLLNSVYLSMLLAYGLDAALIDPTDKMVMGSLKASECLLAEDERCLGYIKYKRGE